MIKYTSTRFFILKKHCTNRVYQTNMRIYDLGLNRRTSGPSLSQNNRTSSENCYAVSGIKVISLLHVKVSPKRLKWKVSVEFRHICFRQLINEKLHYCNAFYRDFSFWIIKRRRQFIWLTLDHMESRQFIWIKSGKAYVSNTLYHAKAVCAIYIVNIFKFVNKHRALMDMKSAFAFSAV